MSLRRRQRWLAAGGALLAPVGVWLGHTAEYIRVGGMSGLRGELFTSLHAYMLPLGVLLALLAAAAGIRIWNAWCALGRRMVSGRAALLRAWRGRTPDSPPPGDATSCPRPGFLAVWVPLTLLQLALYLLQENLEAAAAGHPLPVLAPVTGAHWAAPLVHAGVSLLLAAGIVVLARLLGRRGHAVDVLERLVHTLAHHLGRSCDESLPAIWFPSPLDRLGRRLLPRPPPALVTS
jgi:hypothetical protein